MTENLPRRRVHHASPGLHRAERLQEREVATGIDFEVEDRINHRVDVTDLAGEVEDDLGLAAESATASRSPMSATMTSTSPSEGRFSRRPP